MCYNIRATSGGTVRAASLLVIVFLFGFTPLASSQCRSPEDVAAFRASFERAFQCSGMDCGPSRLPSCAGEFVEDLRNLTGYTAPGRTGQTRCEQQILNSTTDYVWIKYDRILRHGDELQKAERIAAHAWDPIDNACRVPVSNNGYSDSPVVGPQCAGVVGPPGTMVDSRVLTACLHNFVQAWFDLRYGPFAEPEFPR